VRFFTEFTLSEIRFFPFTSFRASAHTLRMTKSEGLRMTRSEGLRMTRSEGLRMTGSEGLRLIEGWLNS